MTEGAGLDGRGVEASWASWVSMGSWVVASAVSTWPVQDSLMSSLELISISASLAILRVYSLIEEEKEHDLMEALQDWTLLAREDMRPLSIGLLVLGIEGRT